MQATLVLGVVILTGSVIYTLHRALTYPLLLFPLALLAVSMFHKWPFDWDILMPIKQSGIESHVEKQRLELRRQKNPLDPIFAEWGAQVHFLYCSGWAILLGLYVGARLQSHLIATSNRHMLIAVALPVIFSGAFIHHVRLLHRIMIEASLGVGRVGSKHST